VRGWHVYVYGPEAIEELRLNRDSDPVCHDGGDAERRPFLFPTSADELKRVLSSYL